MFRNNSIANNHQKNRNLINGCPFCEPLVGTRSIIKVYDNFIITKNDFPYAHWDSHPVKDHYLLVPKRHIDSLGLLNVKEQTEFMAILINYERRGYNIYSRAKGSKQKSVPKHQHTHLIKTKGKEINLLFYIKKPYFLFKF
jgi:diadenosine tetraphosphate (Ap4A) HIT family hydrolase